MRISNCQLLKLAERRPIISAPSSVVAIAGVCASALSLLSAAPAHAGWGRNILHAVAPSLVHRSDATARKELRDQNSQKLSLDGISVTQSIPVPAPVLVPVRVATRAPSVTISSRYQTPASAQAITSIRPAPEFSSVPASAVASSSLAPRTNFYSTNSVTSVSYKTIAPLPGVNSRAYSPATSVSAVNTSPVTPSVTSSSGTNSSGINSAANRLDVIAVAPVAFDPLSFEWKPRPALDYLSSGKDEAPMTFEKPLSRPISTVPVRPEPPLIKPRLPVSSIAPSVVSRAFEKGTAGDYSWEDLTAAGVFEDDPLRGSIYKRKGSVKYIILHSTETASPADARRVILSWNNRGLKHPGAQFVVDRDGTICSTTNPDLVVIHIEPSRALAGYSNDNSIGIEIVRSGKQEYTRAQLDSVNRLVSYLQSHYCIPDANVTTHHHVQPSDRSDPVNFDMLAFESEKASLQAAAIAYRTSPNRSARLIHPVQPPRVRAAAPSGDLDDALFAADEKQPSTLNSSSPESTRYLSTMPKAAPDFRRRNKELVLRD